MEHIEEDGRSWDDELGEPVDGTHLLDPITGKKILRPRNAWILYRNARLDDVEKLPDGSRQPMAEASKIISRWWKSESQGVKARYELEAEREKEEHRRKYPNYRFQPKTKQQKQREQAARREAKKKQQVTKKTRAIANQAVIEPQASTFAPPTLSPPLSLASTPLHVPSPISSSDQESSSYSTSATSPLSASPAGALGLLPSMTFTGQEAANARVPQRTPVRIPPRPKGQRHGSLSATSSRVPSSSTIGSATPQTPTFDSASSSRLSPLPWLPVRQQSSPAPEGNSLSPFHPVNEDPATSVDAWIDESAFEPGPEASGPLSFDLGFPAQFDLGEFQRYFDPGQLNSFEAQDRQGIFQLPAESFLNSAPGQIEVSLNVPQMGGGSVTREEHEAFRVVLESFDFPSFASPAGQQSLAGPSHYAAESATGSETKDVMPSYIPSTVPQQLDASYDSSTVQPEDLVSSSQQQPQVHPQDQNALEQQLSPVHMGFPFDVPPELASNPVFQDWLSKVASSQLMPQQPAISHSPAENFLQHTPSTQHVSSSGTRPPLPSPLLHSYSTLDPIKSLPSPPITESRPSQSSPPRPNSFVPPPGAYRTHARRVAASWKPPSPHPAADPWSSSATPTTGSQLPPSSWQDVST